MMLLIYSNIDMHKRLQAPHQLDDGTTLIHSAMNILSVMDAHKEDVIDPLIEAHQASNYTYHNR